MMDPFLTLALGATAMAAAAVFVAVWQWRRTTALVAERRRLVAAGERDHEILGAAPDGLFLWDRQEGTEKCSRRLAVLLGLAAGTESRFEDVSARFEGESAAALNQAVAGLRREGTSFDLLLPLSGRMIQAVGAHAGAADGQPIADLMWMRDVTATGAAFAGGSAPDRGGGDATAAAERDRLRALLDALPMPVWLRDDDAALRFTNRACGGDAIAEPARLLAVRARAEGRPLNEQHLLTLDGGDRLMEITETPVEGWAGTAGFAIDRPAVDAREGEYARLVAARDQMLDNLATAIAIFGADARLQFFNSAYAELWRLDRDWLETNPGLDDILERLRGLRRLPETADFRAYKREQLDQFGTLEEAVESMMHLPDGTALRIVVSPYALGGLFFAYEDVSGQLALERSLNTLAAVQGETLDNLYEGVAVFGSDGRLQLNNPVFAELWDLSKDDLRDKPHIAEFVDRMEPFIIGEDDWQAYREKVIARLMGREPSSGRLVRADGRVVDYANVPLPDGAVLLSYLDVTDSVRVEFALRQRAEALQEADRLKSEFIANVSFELRTPLNTLVGFADILAEEYFGKLNQRQAEYSRGIVEASQGLTSIINDILDLANIEAGNLALELDTVDLHSMLVSVFALIRERARRKNLKLEFDCRPEIGWIVVDEKRVKQVLFSLLSNAVNFTPPHGTLRLESTRTDSEVIIAVIDTGLGIPIADQERVFQSFQHASSVEARQGGAGLGLSLVKRFIELHGGQVEIVSAPNKGTRVTCHLPTEGAKAEE